MTNHEEDVLKKWRPGTQEVESFFVKYRIDDEPFGMYIPANDNRDARKQLARMLPAAKQIEAAQQEPTDEHKEQIKNLDNEQ